MIHPDKCHRDGASSAFQMLKASFDKKHKKDDEKKKKHDERDKQATAKTEKRATMNRKQREKQRQECKAAWQAAKEEKARIAKGNQKKARAPKNTTIMRVALRTVMLPGPGTTSARLTLQRRLMRRLKPWPRQKP